jgi:hypothetical protein
VSDGHKTTASRCASCRHWEEAPDYSEPFEVRRCRAAPHWQQALQWSDDGEKQELLPEHAGRLAFAADGSGYQAELLTRAEFGCVQWEAK